MSERPGNGRFLRDVRLVASHEWADSIRTKRAILLLLLFGGCAVLGTSWFIRLLKAAESQLVKTLGLDAGVSGGATAALWQSDFFRHTITGMVGDKDVAEALLACTPIGLYFGWLAMTFAPWLVALTASARLTDEIWSGSARFVLCRTSRLAWLLGKVLGQALQLFAALTLCAAAAWITARLMLDSMEGARTLADMALFVPKAWVYGLSFLGLVSGLSLFCRSPGVANVLGIVGCIAASAIYHTAHHFAGEGWRRILDAVQLLLPRHHYFDLMRPEATHALSGAVFALALGFGYLMIGYARLSRRDV